MIPARRYPDIVGTVLLGLHKTIFVPGSPLSETGHPIKSGWLGMSIMVVSMVATSFSSSPS